MQNEDPPSFHAEVQAAFNRRLDWEYLALRPKSESYAGLWEALFATKESLLLLAGGMDELRRMLVETRSAEAKATDEPEL